MTAETTTTARRRPVAPRLGVGRVLLLAIAPLLGGCGTLLPVIPAPEQVRRIEPEFTTTVPVEEPLPSLRLEGRTESERIAITAYRDNLRSVVNITTLSVYRNRLGGSFPSAGSGSGFFRDADGHVITNNHVIENSQSVVVTMYDGSNYPAEVIGVDEELDIAVIRIDAFGRPLEPVAWGTSRTLQIGQTVFALGNPFGLEGTLTSGLVSGLRRPMETDSGFLVNNLIQTDTAINPGNSGGPLLDSDGLVVGMNVSIVSPTGANVGIGFALPADTVVRVADQLVATGRVDRGWIELTGVPLDPALAQAAGIAVSRGLLVTRVARDGNADRAGIRGGEDGRTVQRGSYVIPVEGDVVVAVNGTQIVSLATYFGALATTQPGDQAVVLLRRGDQEIRTSVELTSRRN